MISLLLVLINWTGRSTFGSDNRVRYVKRQLIMDLSLSRTNAGSLTGINAHKNSLINNVTSHPYGIHKEMTPLWPNTEKG